MDEHMTQNDSSWVNTFVFIAGILLGAGTAILLTPETGSQLRNRLARGAKTAQDEFSDMACQTRDALHTWSDEAKKTMQQAANRVNSAVDATKQAVQTEVSND
jgi:gas vesicle protein